MGAGVDLQNKKFGSLLVLKRLENKISKTKTGTVHINRVWECICDCGAVCTPTSHHLLSGKTKSCKKCIYLNCTQHKNKQPIEQALFKRKISGPAKRKGIPCSIDYKEFISVSTKPCHYCGDEPVECKIYEPNKYVNVETFISHGLDRVDSKKGYEKGNIVSCCTTCNTMKMQLTVDEFLKHIKKILATKN